MVPLAEVGNTGEWSGSGRRGGEGHVKKQRDDAGIGWDQCNLSVSFEV